MTGRHAKPVELKKLNGNPGRRRLPDELVQLKRNIGEPPSWLDKSAKEVWHRLQPRIERLGFVYETDEEAFTMLCEAYGRYIDLAKVVKKYGDNGCYTTHSDRGSVRHMVRPEMTLLQDAYARVIKMMDRFGLSPSYRGKLGIQLADPKKNDPMKDLLGR